jgi:membrane associated rhomboid family serine protease
MRFAFAQIVIGAAVVLVGLHLTFMAFEFERYIAAALALFGALVGVLLVASGDREWQDSLDAEEADELKGEFME